MGGHAGQTNESSVIPGLVGTLTRDKKAELQHQVEQGATQAAAGVGPIPADAADHWRAYVNHHADQFLPDIDISDVRKDMRGAIRDVVRGGDTELADAIGSAAQDDLDRRVDQALSTIDRLLQRDLDVSPRLLGDARAKLEAADTPQEQRAALDLANTAIAASRPDHENGDESDGATGDGNTLSETNATLRQLKDTAIQKKQDYVTARRTAERAINAYNDFRDEVTNSTTAQHLADLKQAMERAMDARDAAHQAWQVAQQAVENAGTR